MSDTYNPSTVGIGLVPPSSESWVPNPAKKSTNFNQADSYSSGGSNDPKAPSADTEASTEIKGLTYGQEMHPNANLISSLSNLLSQLTPAQAQSLLKTSGLAGSTLANNLTAALQGESVNQIVAGDQQAANPQSGGYPYGFDPLSIGRAFTDVMAPWLKQISQQGATAENNLASNLTSALGGASPQMQAAMQAVGPALNAATQNETQALDSAAATAPQWDALISTLTNLMNAEKGAQAAAQAEPYWAATTTGVAPSSATPGSQALNGIVNQIIAQGH